MATNPEQQFEPGSIIRLTGVHELRALEDVVAEFIDPHMHDTWRQSWEGRQNIESLIRPPGYNGSLRDIELSVMEAPYEQLITSGEAGWKLHGRTGGRVFERTSEASRETIAKYIGFDLLCDARSSGKGVIGQVQTKLWYLPAPQYKDNTSPTARAHRYTGAYGGRSVHRVVAKPRYEKEKFIQFDEDAKRVGLTVLRQMLLPVTRSKRPFRED